jgi:hypothetical protein
MKLQIAEGRLQIQLADCRFNWQTADSIGRLQIQLADCRFNWQTADSIGQTADLIAGLQIGARIEYGAGL